MGKAGGIVGLIAGIFGVGAALFTLLMGGAGAAFDAAGFDRIIAYGWWGVAAAFMVIVFGAVAIFNGAVGAFGLLAFSLIGAVLGGTAVAIALALGALGGVLAAIGAKKWWPWAGLLAGLAVAVPILISMGDPRKTDQQTATPAEQPAPHQIEQVAAAQATDTVVSCASEPVQVAVKKDFLNELMIKGGASSYARLWGLIGEGESIDARLATDTHRLLPLLSLNEIAASAAPSGCIATLFFGPHTQFPIRSAYTIFPLANGTGFRIESAFILPESGMAQVNLLQGMQKGVLNVLFERELADRETKAATIDTQVTATAPPIAPSFDCSKAGTNVELMICKSSDLSKADAEMALLYKTAHSAALKKPDQERWAFEDQSAHWLQRRNKCSDEACIRALYVERATDLRPQ